MLALLILLGFLLCGFMIAEQLFGHKAGLVRLWLGLCLGLLMMMWLPALYAFFLDFTRLSTLLGLLTAALIAAVLGLRSRRARCRINRALIKSSPFFGDFPPMLLLALVLPLSLISIYLQYSHILRDVDAALHVGQSTYGDLCLHLGIASSARNAAFPLSYSILPGTALGYPFLSDTMVTSMLLFGGKLAPSFVITGSLMMVLVYVGFVLLAWELTKKKAAVVLACVLMFLNGGLGFIYTFDGAWKDPTMLREVFTGFYKTPTNMPELNLRWVNVICDMMVPQRTLLCGWMLVIPAFYMLVDAVRSREIRRFAFLGLWAGLMPMAHTHSFMALGLLSVGLMLQQLLSQKKEARHQLFIGFVLYGAVTLALALPQLLKWTFPQTVGGGSLAFRFNWVNNQGNGKLIDGYFWFWIKNVGLIYILMLPAALSARKGSLMRGLALGALIIYTVAELIQFQPNPYDNNKLFYLAFMLMLPCVALYLVKLWEHMRGLRGRVLLAVLFIAASTISGSLSLGRELVSDYVLFSESEVRAAEFIEENTEEGAIILTADQHNNAVAALTGRSIVCGTPSYLYYHGVDYSSQMQAQENMLSKPSQSLSLFDEYDVDYVYISSQEIYRYGADTQWFEDNCIKLYDEGDIRIFKSPSVAMLDIENEA